MPYMTGMTQTSSIAPGAIITEIDGPSIERLVRTFYGRAREDDVIGPIFNAAVAALRELLCVGSSGHISQIHGVSPAFHRVGRLCS